MTILGIACFPANPHGRPVVPIVMVFREGGLLRDGLEMRALGTDIMWFRFRIVRVWTVEGAEIVNQGWKGMYPLLPLMRWEGRNAEAVLEDSQRMILEEIGDREHRADAYVALRVLSGMRHSLTLIDRILSSAAVRSQEKSECDEEFFSVSVA